jgi:hypothetical protein
LLFLLAIGFWFRCQNGFEIDSPRLTPSASKEFFHCIMSTAKARAGAAYQPVGESDQTSENGQIIIEILQPQQLESRLQTNFW